MAAALVSSVLNRPAPPDALFLGELGLGGEIRPMAGIEQGVAAYVDWLEGRLAEVGKILEAARIKQPKVVDGIKAAIRTGIRSIEHGIYLDDGVNPTAERNRITNAGIGMEIVKVGDYVIVQGMGGLMSVTGLPGQGPVRVGIPIADLCGGIFAAYGITVALLEREQSGKGQWLHTSLLEAMVYMMDFQTARWTIDGEIPAQAGNFHPTSIPTGVYRTRDGHINIAGSGKLFERLCQAIGAPELAKNPDFAGHLERGKNRVPDQRP